MKILLDECLPVDSPRSLTGHEVHTVQWAGLKGKKNGESLDAAGTAGYQVFVTVDQGISRQRHFAGGKLSIIVLRSRTNQIEDLLPLAPAIMRTLDSIHSGQTIVVPLPD